MSRLGPRKKTFEKHIHVFEISGLMKITRKKIRLIASRRWSIQKLKHIDVSRSESRKEKRLHEDKTSLVHYDVCHRALYIKMYAIGKGQDKVRRKKHIVNLLANGNNYASQDSRVTYIHVLVLTNFDQGFVCN